MSDLDEKLAKPDHHVDDVARQTLGQLRKRIWVEAFTGRPELIRVETMGRIELWKRANNGTTGEHTTYELQRGPV